MPGPGPKAPGRTGSTRGGASSGGAVSPAEAIANEAATAVRDAATEYVTNAVDMQVELFGETFEEAFQPPPSSNPVCLAAHYASAIMGVVGYVEEVQNVGLAALTAPIAAILPPLPAMTLGGVSLGIPHTHIHPPSLIPPAPPIPLPSIGVVTAPGALSVAVSGMPAARAGDVGMIITCGTIAPPFELVLGSSNTFFAGSRAARIGTDMQFHDNPVPMEGFNALMAVAGAVTAHLNAASQVIQASPGAAAMTELQQAAEAVALILKQTRKLDCGGPPDMGPILVGAFNVLIGGMPLPPAKDLGDVMAGLRRAGRAIHERLSGDSEDGNGDGTHRDRPEDSTIGSVCPT
ncbi:MAG: PAAR domain-containing protein [Sandaracinaceae bacterium]